VISWDVAEGSKATMMGLSAVPNGTAVAVGSAVGTSVGGSVGAFVGAVVGAFVGAVIGAVVSAGAFVGAAVVAVAQADKMKLAITINTNKVVSRFFTIQLLLIRFKHGYRIYTTD
jgi:uncharacterized protein YqgC (DUF456 family)